MVTLSQLHLAGAAAANLQPRQAAIVRKFSRQPSLGGVIRGGVPRLCISKSVSSRREVFARKSDSHLVLEEFVEDGEAGAAMATEETGGLLSRLPFKGVAAAAGMMFLEAAGAAYATEFPNRVAVPEPEEELMRFSPEAWINIYITTGVWLVLYFLVIPLVVYNYLRLRWYKRSFFETFFQFMLVFLFFPGMLLLAPFINFRRLPRDGAEEP